MQANSCGNASGEILVSQTKTKVDMPSPGKVLGRVGAGCVVTGAITAGVAPGTFPNCPAKLAVTSR